MLFCILVMDIRKRRAANVAANDAIQLMQGGGLSTDDLKSTYNQCKKYRGVLRAVAENDRLVNTLCDITKDCFHTGPKAVKLLCQFMGAKSLTTATIVLAKASSLATALPGLIIDLQQLIFRLKNPLELQQFMKSRAALLSKALKLALNDPGIGPHISSELNDLADVLTTVSKV